VVFGLQFIAMAIWSDVQYSRFALTSDAATYIQAFHLISHGDLSPFSSTHGSLFVLDHLDLMAWPLSLFDWLGPQGLAVLWAQDLFVVLAEVAAFAWMRHIVSTRRVRQGSVLTPNVVLGLGLLLLVANPWSYWSIADDIHIEPFAMVFIVLAAFEFSRGNHHWAWFWVLITVLSGDVPASYVLGLGISALLAARFIRDTRRVPYRTGLLLIGVAVAWGAFATLLGANRGTSSLFLYGFLAVGVGAAVPRHLGVLGFLKGVVEHPTNLLNALWRRRGNIYAHTAPDGWVGTLTPWTFGVPLVVLLENNLERPGNFAFSFEVFQNLPVCVFAAVGTVVILVWVASRFNLPKSLGIAIVAVLAANAILWAAVWIP
jgi:hypothetical protein